MQVGRLRHQKDRFKQPQHTGRREGTESKEEELERTGTEGDTSLKDTGIDLLSLPL